VSKAVFELTHGGVFATELARGPWDPDAQHGGAPAALLVRAFERCSPAADLALARVSYEFLRPVPLGRLGVQADLGRPGRRVQLLEASILTPAGIEVVRARALRVARADAASTPEGPGLTPGPDQGRENDFRRTPQVMFATDAMEIRFVAGGFYEPGPASAWFRLRRPLVDGEEPSPLQRLAAAGDFGNGISAVMSWDDHLFINPDLTLYIEREPVGEWIGLESQTRIASGGIAIAESVLYDQRGRVGRAIQALLVAPRR
jgi:Thioesterase-like superfamily